ncbi:hypothetical protein FM119_11890 [Mycetocola reblochoni REB411]|uniref:Uncharacterized protein n=1 Tax=Mycetocola reblochoni REB411 TaxID=1255698 RepID=A0A1R4K7E6_9MICO|nr:hypothetical protein FM119_11890 [Mycetocola reblochoni REB411]
MWIAIGAVIASALVCVVWVLVGDDGNAIIGRAFLTILLLAAFAGVALYDASAAARRRQWESLLSLGGWVLILALAMIKIWMPFRDSFDYYFASDSAFVRTFQLIGIVLVIRLAILHVQLFSRLLTNRADRFARIDGFITIGLVAVLAVLLVIPLVFTDYVFHSIYYRAAVAVAILATVGTVLVPLFRLLSSAGSTKEPARAAQAAPQRGFDALGAGYSAPTGDDTGSGVATQVPAGQGSVVAGPAHTTQAQAGVPARESVPSHSRQPGAPIPRNLPTRFGWPLFADGRTPLPVLHNGAPDLDAYYTGRLSASARVMTDAEWDTLRVTFERAQSAPASAPAAGAATGAATGASPVDGGATHADVPPVDPPAEHGGTDAPSTGGTGSATGDAPGSDAVQAGDGSSAGSD